LERRDILKGLGWLAGAVVASIPRNIYAPSMPIEQLQSALGFLGYLPPGSVTGMADERTERALLRFKKHARRAYRISRDGAPEDVAAPQRFGGAVDTTVAEETIFEIKQWVERGWKLPLGRFRFVSLADAGEPGLRGYRMREDAARAWCEVVREASARGATLDAPYGDTWRPLGYARKNGASRRSMHFCGRAVDLNQGLAQGPNQRYYLSREEARGRTFFRLLCRTARQDGTQGVLYRSGAVACWRAGVRRELPLPQGWYVDLTALLAEAHFERIPAQRRWEAYSDVGSEWWHYHFVVDRQPTFLDECELVGISERRLLALGYTISEIDRRPG
jgi:hypothetical protein